MLSNTWTFSLKILVLILAFGFVASSAANIFQPCLFPIVSPVGYLCKK